MNKIFLSGNLVKAPEASETTDGTKFCKFALAVDRHRSSNGDKEVDYFNITCFRTQAENCVNNLNKGDKIGIIGSAYNREYKDKTGATRYALDIVASEVEFLRVSKFEKKESNENDLIDMALDDICFRGK